MYEQQGRQNHVEQPVERVTGDGHRCRRARGVSVFKPGHAATTSRRERKESPCNGAATRTGEERGRQARQGKRGRTRQAEAGAERNASEPEEGGRGWRGYG